MDSVHDSILGYLYRHLTKAYPGPKQTPSLRKAIPITGRSLPDHLHYHRSAAAASVAVDMPDTPDTQARPASVDYRAHLVVVPKAAAALAAVAAAAKLAGPSSLHCLAAKSKYCSETRTSASVGGTEGRRGRFAAFVVEVAQVALAVVAEGYVAAAAVGIRHSLVDFVSDTAAALVLGAADCRIVLVGTSADYRLAIHSRPWKVLAGFRC